MNVLMLAGCSNTKDFLSECIIQASGIGENQEYQQAQKLKEEDKLNIEGEYNELEENEYQINEGYDQKQVHVTIADNSFLEIDYFFDAEHVQKVDETSFYLEPGEKLYCSQPESKNVNSNTYIFSEFQIYEYNSDGTKGKLFGITGDNDVILEIPENYEGTELAIYPVGIYEKRGLGFYAFYYDEFGKEKAVPSGTWKVNDIICNDDVVQIDAADSYTVKYEYDRDTYYYVNAEPSPFSSVQPGIVEFKKESSLSNADSYRVELHPYIAAVFSYDKGDKKGIRSVLVNDLEQDFEQKITKLKEGDQIVIVTDNDYRIYCSEITLNEPEKIDDGYRYTFHIPKMTKTELDFKVFKSELKVVLDKTVGFDLLFDFIGSGINETNCHYSKQKLNADLTIYDGSIGIEKKVSITAKDGVIDDGYAVKFEIEKTDGNGQMQKEVKYIENTPETIMVDLYDSTKEIVNVDKIYKNVLIKVSLVPAIVYHQKTIENGKILVKLVDSLEEENLSEGDIMEASQKVDVTIVPDRGYYVSGKDVDNYEFTATMKLSKYDADIDKIIKEHEIKRLYKVVLDTADLYGECVYKLNGEVVNGEIYVREEDKLTLEYQLTNTNYQILRETEGFWGSIKDWRKNTFSKTKEAITIPILNDLDGITIKREDYIKVGKKGV